MPRPRVDAIVIGAGAAGLAATRELSESGLTAIVLEARDRIGGRILTVHDSNSPVPLELGAEFVHGEPAETFDIIRAAQLQTVQLPDTHYRLLNGRLVFTDDFWEKLQKMLQPMVRAVNRSKTDFSLADYFHRSKLTDEARQMLLNYIHGYHAAYEDKISARFLAAGDEEQESDNKQFRVITGYDGIIEWLRAGFDPDRVEMRLNTAATELRWKRGEVIVECTTATGATSEPFHANAAVITLPNAVLKAKALSIAPRLPEKERAWEKLEAGQIFKIVLRFRKNFWEEASFWKQHIHRQSSNSEELNFVHAEEEDVPVWWTAAPGRAPILTGWAGGPKAEMLLAEDEGTRIRKTLASLARILTVPRHLIDESLDSWSSHDWKSDSFSRAAYTYVAVGGVSAPKLLAKPVQETLFFAGEATDLDQMGTVAGAIASGKSAARKLARALKRSTGARVSS